MILSEPLEGTRFSKNKECISKAIERNEGYCPCNYAKTEETKCPCRTYREVKKCECNLYEVIE